MSGSKRGKAFMNEDIEVIPEVTETPRSKKRKVESDLLALADTTSRTRSNRRAVEEPPQDPEPALERGRRHTPRKPSFVPPQPPPSRARRNSHKSDEDEEEDEEEEEPIPLPKKPAKRKGGPGRKKKVQKEQSEEEDGIQEDDGHSEDEEQEALKNNDKKQKGKLNGKHSKSEEPSDNEEEEEEENEEEDYPVNEDANEDADDDGDQEDEDDGNEEEDEDGSTATGSIKLTIKPPKPVSEKRRVKIREPSMIYGRSSRVPPPEVTQINRKRRKVKSGGEVPEEIPSGDEIHSDEDLVDIEDEDRPAFEKMKESVGVPVVMLPKRGNQEFYFATDIARWSGLEKANRLYDRCPMMGHFNSDSDETALFIERNLMSRHLKGRSVGIVKASDVFKYVLPRLDEFRKRGMMLEEKRNETRVYEKPKTREATSYSQTYFPPEILHVKFVGSKESLMKNATKSALTFNSQLLLDRRNRERYFDPNTQISQIPQGKLPVINAPPPTQYPIALMKGQHIDSFTDLTPEAISKVVHEFISTKKKDFPALSQPGAKVPPTPANFSTPGRSATMPFPQQPKPPALFTTPKTLQSARSFSNSPAVPSSPVLVSAPKPSQHSKPEQVTCMTCGQSDDADTMVECAKCHTVGHPNCMEVPEELVSKIKSYQWHCFSCKVCMVCSNPHDEHLILLCDDCDRGCHTYCATPKLSALPSGHWACSICKAEKQSS